MFLCEDLVITWYNTLLMCVKTLGYQCEQLWLNILPLNSYMQPVDGFVISRNVYMELIYRLLNIQLLVTEEWLGLLSCLLRYILPSFLPPPPLSFFQLDSLTGTLKETFIIRPVHTEKGQADSNCCCIANVVGINTFKSRPKCQLSSPRFISFPPLLKE